MFMLDDKAILQCKMLSAYLAMAHIRILVFGDVCDHRNICSWVKPSGE